MPWKPSVSGGLPAPIPSEKRPPEQRCSPAAASAIVAGVRPQAERTDVPRPMREVRWRELREQDRRVVRPPLGDLDAIEPELVRLGRRAAR